MSTFPTDAEREAVRDELAHTTIGTGYYSTTVDIDAAREMTDHALDALAPLVADRERAAAARALREAAVAPTPWDGRTTQAKLLVAWLRDRADEMEAGKDRG